jgi:hypothetical protein
MIDKTVSRWIEKAAQPAPERQYHTRVALPYWFKGRLAQAREAERRETGRLPRIQDIVAEQLSLYCDRWLGEEKGDAA